MRKRYEQAKKLLHKWREGLWLDELYLKRRWYVVLIRILAILWRGVFDNSLFTRASALSYSSLLALAPILGVFVILSGSFFSMNAEEHVKKVFFLIAPTLEEYIADDAATEPEIIQTTTDAAPGTESRPETEKKLTRAREMDNALDLLIRHMIDGVRENLHGISKAGKGVASAIGALVLVWMGITLLIAIENVMNSIWGVKSGRALGKKVVLYWALLSLGILGALILVGLSSAETLGKGLLALPFGESLAKHATSIAAILSGISLTLVLTFFYKFFPNTRVRFVPALIGGFVTASLLVANKMLSMMYINKVLTIQSLFGSMGIILVLMFGLYLFWAFLLVGGQLTYAVQNAQFLADQKAWANASHRAREMTALAALVLVSRRFAHCEPALSSDEIAEQLRVPANILNEALLRLCEMGLLTSLENGQGKDEGSDRVCFMPARPTSSMSFAAFHNAYMSLGDERGLGKLRNADPAVGLFWKRMEDALATMPDESLEAIVTRAAAEKPEERT
jgi:membrane protein